MEALSENTSAGSSINCRAKLNSFEIGSENPLERDFFRDSQPVPLLLTVSLMANSEIGSPFAPSLHTARTQLKRCLECLMVLSSSLMKLTNFFTCEFNFVQISKFKMKHTHDTDFGPTMPLGFHSPIRPFIRMVITKRLPACSGRLLQLRRANTSRNLS